MSRIFGFLAGVLLVFGGLYYLLAPAGVPPANVELRLGGPPAEKPLPPTQPDSVPAPEESAETGLPEPDEPRPAAPSGPAEVRLADEPAAAEDAPLPPAMDIADEQALVERALTAMQEQLQQQAQPGPGASSTPDAAPDDDAPGPAAADDTQWFAVWDPFHSELSAKAFAGRLERMTGLDYRVVRSGPAKYEVAVAFRSEEERVANIALIEEATGLRIAGGSL